jgi:hypothetical protein
MNDSDNEINATKATADKGAPQSSRIYLSERQVEAEYGISRAFLQKSRRSGDGPIFFKPNGRVYYTREVLDAWFTASQRKSTSDTPSASGSKSRSKRPCSHCGCDCGGRA